MAEVDAGSTSTPSVDSISLAGDVGQLPISGHSPLHSLSPFAQAPRTCRTPAKRCGPQYKGGGMHTLLAAPPRPGRHKAGEKEDGGSARGAP